MLVGDGTDWSVAHDMRELRRVAAALDIRIANARFLNVSRGQAAFFGSQFQLLRPGRVPPQHALMTAYFHGRPGTPGMPEFDDCFACLRELHPRIERVQVTHAEMRDLVLAAGVDPGKVHTIRIGVNVNAFRMRSDVERRDARTALGIPQSAFVVGSFQKDGVGWGAGDEPKLIKGPDVLVAALARVRDRVPELLVVLSGPARGYVRVELERLGIPYVHRFVRRYEQLRDLYLPLDAVAVASRQEGGPKAVLEAMAVGVPIVSTRVGQAQELLDGSNGRLVDVEDAEALGAELVAAADAPPDQVERARATAEANAYSEQLPLWHAFFAGLVAQRDGGVGR